jgi:hypothetical protein
VVKEVEVIKEVPGPERVVEVIKEVPIYSHSPSVAAATPPQPSPGQGPAAGGAAGAARTAILHTPSRRAAPLLPVPRAMGSAAKDSAGSAAGSAAAAAVAEGVPPQLSSSRSSPMVAKHSSYRSAFE